MSNPLISSVMKEKFSKLIQVLECLNALHGSISKKTRFRFEFVGSRLFVYGLLVELCQLYALLWASCEHYSFFMGSNDKGDYIEVMFNGCFDSEV